MHPGGPLPDAALSRHSREDCFDADGWFHTGDIVRIDDDGYVYFQGRAGSMIKTAGANVTPSEVEKALAALGLTAHVLGLPDRERGEVVAAVIVTDGDVDAGAIRTALRDTLSAFKIPRVVTTCRASRVPMLASGKVDLGGCGSCSPMSDTIGTVLRTRAGLDKAMVVDTATALTYAELDSGTATVAAGLVGTGITKGTRVGLLMPNGTDWCCWRWQ